MSDKPQKDSDLKAPHHYGEGSDVDNGVDMTLKGEESQESSTQENIISINLVLVVLFGALALWGGIKIIEDTQSFDPLVYNPYQEKRVGPIEPPSLFDIGKKVYAKNCATCHMADGNGVPGTFPTLHDTAWVLESKDRVINLVLSGLTGPIEVKGNTYNNNMPAWGNVLSDKEIAAVLTFIRQNEAWGNSASEITEDMVAAMRADYGVRAQAWTGPELLEQFPADPPQAEPEAEASPEGAEDASAQETQES